MTTELPPWDGRTRIEWFTGYAGFRAEMLDSRKKRRTRRRGDTKVEQDEPDPGFEDVVRCYEENR